MLAILAASVIVDPLVLQVLLNGLARNQLDTKYGHLFVINLVLSVIALAAALLILPVEEDLSSVHMTAGLLFVLTVGVLIPCTHVSAVRGVLVTALFFAYKSILVLSLIRLLAVFGLLIHFEGIDLDALGDTETPEIIEWLLENGLWFKSEQESY